MVLKYSHVIPGAIKLNAATFYNASLQKHFVCHSKLLASVFLSFLHVITENYVPVSLGYYIRSDSFLLYITIMRHYF